MDITMKSACGAILGLALAMTFAPFSASAETLRLVTETYPPLNYLENGQIKGSSMDQIALIMKEANIPYSVEIMPWARALALAEIEPYFCVFTAVRNAEREARFKWVGPLMKSRTMLIRKQGAKVAPTTLDQAKAYIIGTQRGDFTHDILKANNFPKIDLATDLDLSLKKLMSGRTDLMPVSEKYYERLKRDGAQIETVLTLAQSAYAIACNPSVSDSTIASMQQELDKLIADGTQQRIFSTYGVNAGESASN